MLHVKTGDEGIWCGLVFNCLKHGACLMERSVTGSLFVLGITYEVFITGFELNGRPIVSGD